MASPEVLLTFQLGKPLGMKLGKNSLDVGIVNRSGQATERGVKLGWKVLGVKDKDCSNFAEFAKTLDALRAAGQKSCEVRFRTEKAATAKTNVAGNSDATEASADLDCREADSEVEGVLELKDSGISGAWDATPDSWRRHWFKASSQHLKYYKSKASPGSHEDCVREVALKRCTVLDANTTTNVFRVLVKGEEHLELRASSLADAERWVDNLQAFIEQGSSGRVSEHVSHGPKNMSEPTLESLSELDMKPLPAPAWEPTSELDLKPLPEPNLEPPSELDLKPLPAPAWEPTPEPAPDLESSEKPVESVLSFFGLGATSDDSKGIPTEQMAAVKENQEDNSDAKEASADIDLREADIEVEGILELKGSGIPGAWDATPDSWQGRWFKASSQHLKYYKSKTSPGSHEDCVREVALKRCTVLDANTTTNVFRVLVKGEEHLELRASSLADAERWVDNLQAFIEESSTRRVSEHVSHGPKNMSEPTLESLSELDMKPLPAPALEPTSEPNPEPTPDLESSEKPVDSVLSFFGLGATSGVSVNAAAEAASPEVSTGVLEPQAEKRPTVEELFEMLAVDADSELTKADVVDAAGSLGLTRDEAAQVFEELDADGNGTLSQGDFLGVRKLTSAFTQLKNLDFLTQPEDEKKHAFTNASQEPPPPPTLSELFTLLDKNGDGTLTKEEVVAGAETLGMTAEGAAELFDKLDSSGSGTLSKDEFGLNLGGLTDLVTNLFTLGLAEQDTPLAITEDGQSSSPEVIYPDLDSDTFEIIENLAHAVTKHGTTFEDSVREKQAENPQYAFLRESDIPAHEYYVQCMVLLTDEGWSLDMVRSERKSATGQDLFALMGGILQSIVVSDAEGTSEATEQAMTIDELFAKVDVNNDGKLTKDEVVGAAGMLGMTSAEAATLFDRLDTSGNGMLTKEEFSFFGDIFRSLKEALPNPEEWIDNCIDLIAGDKQIANEAANVAPDGANPDTFVHEETSLGSIISRTDHNRVTEEAWYEGLVA